MKTITNLVSILLVFAILLVSFPTNVRAEITEIEADASNISPVIELYFEYDYDTTQVYRYETNNIPVDFYIEGLKENQACSVSVSSSLDINNTQRNITIYDAENNYVNLDFSFTDESASLRSSSLSIDYIYITANSDLEGTIPCTLTLYVLNTSQGVFVSYIGEEEVEDYYYQWMFENGIIEEAEYESYLDKKGLTTEIDEATYLETASSTTVARTVQDTYIYINYKITVSGANLTVSGAMTWTDSAGISHPLKQVKVEIVDEDVAFDDVVATTYTSNSGTFSATFENQTIVTENGGCDIFIKAYPISSNIAVKTTSNGNFYLYTPTSSDVSSNVNTIYQMLEPCNTSKAFQIHQAGIVGAQYVKSLSGTAPALLNFRYPYSDSGSNNYNGSYVSIKASSYYSWDIILHEYGHYIQDIYNIEDNPGGTHYIDSNIIDTFVSSGSSLSTAKDKGCRLAWGEGWATYFGLSAQLHQNVSSLGIPGAGDASYDNLYGGWSRDCESYEGHGEGNEMAVTCALWDLADSSTWNGSTSESHDSTALGYSTVWNYTVNSGATTFSEFMEYAYNQMSSTLYRNVGKILAVQNITADSLKTNGSNTSSYYFSSSNVPTFTWDLTEGSTNCTDNYVLQIYDTSMNLIYSIAIASGTKSHTLSTTRWQNLLTNYTNGFYWCVKVTPSSTPSTGPYYSQFIRCYLSNIT